MTSINRILVSKLTNHNRKIAGFLILFFKMFSDTIEDKRRKNVVENQKFLENLQLFNVFNF